MQMIVQPVIALAAWTMLVWLWLYIKRVPALRRSPIDIWHMGWRHGP